MEVDMEKEEYLVSGKYLRGERHEYQIVGKLHTLGWLESKILWGGHWEFTTLVQNETKQEVTTFEVLLRNYNFPSSRKNYRIPSRGVLFISVNHKISQAIPLSYAKGERQRKWTQSTVNHGTKLYVCFF